MNKALTYLTERVSGINPNNPKANKGCRILYPFVDRLDEVDNIAKTILINQLHREDQDDRGRVKLCNLIFKIGQKVALHFDLDIPKGFDLAFIGILFVEAWHNAEESIEVIRDPDFPGHPMRADYIVVPLEPLGNIRLKAVHVSKTRIAGVSRLRQDNHQPIIKGWGPKDEEAFSELLNEPFVKAVSNLQQTGWKVNRTLYEILEPHRDEFNPHPGSKPKTDSADKVLWQRAMSKFAATKAIFNIAEDYKDEDEFYFYADLDWRGRVYYSQPFFNYQGSDYSRGILQFSEGKPIGKSGLYWLAIHLASSYNASYHIDEIPEWCEYDYRTFLESQGLTDISVDKMTLNDRVNWTNSHMEELMDYAESILSDGLLGGLPDCEKPVCFLACCLEFLEISKVSDPEAYVSHLPIPIDGTNNGWQHLGAMSKDEITGDLVGLVPGDVPKDFYVKTAQKLVEIMPDWFEEREIPMKHIRKGISKRGSMTKAYSAGAKKIAANMAVDLRQYGFDEKYNINLGEWGDVKKEHPDPNQDDYYVWEKINNGDCDTLAKNLVKAINVVCPGPLKTMKYLQDLSSHVLVEQKKKHIEWTTPSGFPVKHVYMLDNKENVRITLAAPKGHAHHLKPVGQPKKNGNGDIVGYTGRMNLKIRVYNDKPSLKDTASGISPNYVHSMDAAHMSLVIADWDGSFGAVHDSFSSHACDMEELMTLTRSAFVEMYDYDNYLDHMRDMIVGEDETFEDNQPELGTLNVGEVMESDFFFA